MSRKGIKEQVPEKEQLEAESRCRPCRVGGGVTVDKWCVQSAARLKGKTGGGRKAPVAWMGRDT